MNNELFTQYMQSGQENIVWKRIFELNELAFSAPYWDDVSQVMDECMERVRKNFITLKQELENSGYVFENIGGLNLDYSILELNEEQVDFSNIQYLVEDGIIPSSLHFFYKKIKSVDFRGNFNNWENPFFLDAVVIYSPEEFIVINDGASSFRIDGQLRYYVLFSPDEFLKEDVSGGIGYGIELSETPKIDGNVIRYRKAVTFIDYLRLCFKWGGLVGMDLYNAEEIPDDIMNIILKIRKSMIPF